MWSIVKCFPLLAHVQDRFHIDIQQNIFLQFSIPMIGKVSLEVLLRLMLVLDVFSMIQNGNIHPTTHLSLLTNGKIYLQYIKPILGKDKS